MPVSSFHPETKKWLTSFGPNAKAGDSHTISIGCNIPVPGTIYGRGCEFTTFVLCEPTARDDRWGEPLFDLNECASFFPPTGEPLPRITETRT